MGRHISLTRMFSGASAATFALVLAGVLLIGGSLQVALAPQGSLPAEPAQVQQSANGDVIIEDDEIPMASADEMTKKSTPTVAIIAQGLGATGGVAIAAAFALAISNRKRNIF